LLDFPALSEADEIGCVDEWFAACLVGKHHHATGPRDELGMDCRNPPVELLQTQMASAKKVLFLHVVHALESWQV
jgi:hypothetical protein